MSEQQMINEEQVQQSVAPANVQEVISTGANKPTSRRSSTTSSIEMLDDANELQTIPGDSSELNEKTKVTADQSKSAPESLPVQSSSKEGASEQQNIATSLPASLAELTARTECQRSLVDEIDMSMDLIQTTGQIDSLSSSSASSSSSSSQSDFDHFEQQQCGLNGSDDATRDCVRDSLMKLIDLDKKLIDDLKRENESLTLALETNNQFLKQKKSQQEKCEQEIESLEEKLLLLEIENKSLREHIHRLEIRNKNTQSNIAYPSLNGLAITTNDGATTSAAAAIQQQPQPNTSATAMREPTIDSCRLIQLQFDEPHPNTCNQKPEADEIRRMCEELELKLRCLGKRDHSVRLLYKQLQIFKKDFRDGLKSKTEAEQQIESLQAQIDKLRIDREQKMTGLGSSNHHHHSKHHHHDLPHHRHSLRGLKTHSSTLPTPNHLDDAEKRLSRHMKKREMKAALQAAKRAAYYNTMIHKHQQYLQQAQSTFDKINSTSVLTESAAAKHLRRGPSGPGMDGLDRASPYRHSHSRRQKLRHMQKEVLHDILATTNKAVVTGYKLASSGVNMALDKLQEIELNHQHADNGRHQTMAGPNPLIDLIGQVTELAAQALRPMVSGPAASANSGRH